MLKELLMIFFTVLIPFKMTYTSLLTVKDTKLYGMYWAIYSLICFFCTVYPIHLNVYGYFATLIFCLWLYLPRFRGALVIGNFVHWVLKLNGIVTKIFNVTGKIVNYIQVFQEFPIIKIEEKEKQE